MAVSVGRRQHSIGSDAAQLAAHVKLFLNLENLGNVRQSRWDPMLLPNRAVDGRWTVDAWAPLEGRVINGGVRFMF
jgi:iron complex outermembrane receptor protein